MEPELVAEMRLTEVTAEMLTDLSLMAEPYLQPEVREQPELVAVKKVKFPDLK